MTRHGFILSLLIFPALLAGCREATSDYSDWQVFDIEIDHTRYYPVVWHELPQPDLHKGCVRFVDAGTLRVICSFEYIRVTRWGTVAEWKTQAGIQEGIDNFWQKCKHIPCQP